MRLTDTQRDLLLQVTEGHEGAFHSGGPRLAEVDRERVNELILAGLVQLHPPDRPARVEPTPLGRERVADIRRRQKAARKGARKHAAA
jgi:hypothetical protein